MCLPLSADTQVCCIGAGRLRTAPHASEDRLLKTGISMRKQPRCQASRQSHRRDQSGRPFLLYSKDTQTDRQMLGYRFPVSRQRKACTQHFPERVDHLPPEAPVANTPIHPSDPRPFKSKWCILLNPQDLCL